VLGSRSRLSSEGSAPGLPLAVQAKSARSATLRPKPASTRTRAPRGQNTAKVLAALKNGPMTASQVAKSTGIGTGTVSTMLTKMAKSGELAKAERG
jgi:predicted Rossmann fold nucleotide-binding protein DprA/Smf involved in DNA uptake